jgi:phosphoglycolate phosphatase
MYRDSYGRDGLFQAEVYAGIPEALSAMPMPRYLATAKPHVFARRITAHFGLDQHLAAQFGPELDGTRNDKAELLRFACDQLRLDPKDCVMVGDRSMDLRAARANGMAFVGVSWGYAREGELADADTVCATPDGLVAAIASLR